MSVGQREGNLFTKFHDSVSRIYKIFRVVPISVVRLKNGQLRINEISRITCAGILLLYWIGVGYSFTRTGLINNSVSIVSNCIQLLLNAVSFSVVILNPMLRYRDYYELMVGLNNIEDMFIALKHRFAYIRNRRIFYMSITGILIFLLYNAIFNFYVNVVRYETPVPYWALYSIPLFFYTIATHHVIFLVICIHQRLKAALDLLRIQTNAYNTKAESKSDAIVCLEEETIASLDQLYYTLKDIYVLCVKFNKYVGPVTLSVLGCLFTVTAVQSFYFFNIIMDFDEARHKTVWNLISSGNLIVINLTLVLGLCYSAELIAEDTDNILANIIEGQPNIQVSSKDPCWSVGV